MPNEKRFLFHSVPQRGGCCFYSVGQRSSVRVQPGAQRSCNAQTYTQCIRLCSQHLTPETTLAFGHSRFASGPKRTDALHSAVACGSVVVIVVVVVSVHANPCVCKWLPLTRMCKWLPLTPFRHGVHMPHHLTQCMELGDPCCRDIRSCCTASG